VIHGTDRAPGCLRPANSLKRLHDTRATALGHNMAEGRQRVTRRETLEDPNDAAPPFRTRPRPAASRRASCGPPPPHPPRTPSLTGSYVAWGVLAATSVLLGRDAAAVPKVQARPDYGPVELPSGASRLNARRHACHVSPRRTPRRPGWQANPRFDRQGGALAVLSRLHGFLPQLAESNEQLKQRMATEVRPTCPTRLMLGGVLGVHAADRRVLKSGWYSPHRVVRSRS
jgi:hypothetical protein